MREILFRAKRIDNGEWVEGYYCKWKQIRRNLGSVKEKVVDCIITWMSDGGMSRYEIDSETLCQYTGMTDKNGKRIWENDIVSAWSEGKHAIGKVKRRIDGLYIIYPAYQKTEFWGLCPDGNGKTEVEVIENIFDNPELMKGE